MSSYLIIKNLVVMEKSERKIKWNALASFLLALLLCAGMAGCSDDEDDEPQEEEIILRDDWSDTTGEKIAFTLEHEWGEIDWEKTTDEWVVLAYDDGAYFYYLSDYYGLPEGHQLAMMYPYLYVAVPRDDFEEYGIPENYSKSVWFSAEVTNIGKTAAPEEHPFGTITPVIRKAYLLDL